MAAPSTRASGSALDYEALGFLAGLEIHQQLDTPKLFCRCPSALDEGEDAVLMRTLRPTQSELGEVDRAALAEARKALVFEYRASRATSCLVEIDEEPPHECSPEAVGVALEVSFLLRCRPLDEVHVMRKIVIDGSNTSGFQRTALFALDGSVDSMRGPVGIATLCLEEDSARKLDRRGRVLGYRLDRLGIPLVEIATTPELKDGEHAQEVALAIGTALRATGKVKRGIGTIRQDLNVSIREGARVELKGVQELRLIPIATDYEVRRQVHLLEVREALLERGVRAEDLDGKVEDVSGLFQASASKPIVAALKSGGSVLAVRLPGFSGLLGKKSEPKPGEAPRPRLGRELADYAKVRAGVKGIFHSDELPAYGITAEEVDALRSRLAPGPGDAFVLVAERRAIAAAALEAVVDRARTAFSGVPEETREVVDDGSSAYLRPLPGGARMYPETDVPPFRITEERRRDVRANLPELPQAKIERLRREFPSLSEEQVVQVVRGGEGDLFERLARETGLAKEAARLLTSTLSELEREGVGRDRLPDATLVAALAAVQGGAFAKEALPQVLRHAGTRGVPVEEAVRSLGLGASDLAEVEREVERLVTEREAFVRDRGDAAIGPLMGPLMAKFRGKVSGEELSRMLRDAIARRRAG